MPEEMPEEMPEGNAEMDIVIISDSEPESVGEGGALDGDAEEVMVGNPSGWEDEWGCLPPLYKPCT